MKPLFIVLILVPIVLLGSCIFSPEKDRDKDKGNHVTTGSTREEMPGGLKDLSNPDAPKKIESKDITFFETDFVYADKPQEYGRYDFAAEKKDDGTVEVSWIDYKEESKAVVGPEFLISLQEIIDKHNLASNNGTYRVTSALPFPYEPCSFHCDYESGEKINFCKDGNPDSEWMGDIVDLFTAVVSPPNYTDQTTE